MRSNRMRATWVLLLCLLATCAEALPAQSHTKCLSYEPAIVKLTGRLISHTYPGPPEYESIRKGDQPETYWLLALRNPVCVDEKPATPDADPAQKGIRKIQLVFKSPKMYRTYRALLGKRITVTGPLLAAVTIHHKTPVLLWVESVKRARAHTHGKWTPHGVP